MNKRTTDPGPARPFPEHANLEHLKKEAKQRLKSMRLADSGVKLSAAQFTIAREYGFSSWRSLIAYVKSQPENKVTDFQYSKVKVRQELKSLFDGMEAAGKGDYQTAVANFRHAEMEHPNLTMFEFQRAVAKECGESVWRDLHSYIKSLPAEAQLRPADEDLSTAYNDGLEAARKGDYQTAVEQLRRAVRERPRRIRAHYYLGRSLFRLRLHREARAAFEELLKHDPENLLAHYEIGKLHLYAGNYPPELLNEFDPENLLANYTIGSRYLSPQNYADAIARYQWLKSQSENSTAEYDDSDYELLPEEPQGRGLVQIPFHRAYAAKLAVYLLDLIPPQVAEQYGLPRSRIVFEDDLDQTPVVQDGAQKPAEIIYKVMPKYTEIARINRQEGTVLVNTWFFADEKGSYVAGIRVARGLPDGLTMRAIHATTLVRFTPASLDEKPIRTREQIEYNFKLD